MNDLDPDFMALFSSNVFSSSDELVETIGLDKLMPDAIIDAKIFEPCGFSLNAIDKVTMQTCVLYKTPSSSACLVGLMYSIPSNEWAGLSLRKNEGRITLHCGVLLMKICFSFCICFFNHMVLI